MSLSLSLSLSWEILTKPPNSYVTTHLFWWWSIANARCRFQEFVAESNKLNEVESFVQLRQICEKIGYRLNKVVYRGYTVSLKLQVNSLHLLFLVSCSFSLLFSSSSTISVSYSLSVSSSLSPVIVFLPPYLSLPLHTSPCLSLPLHAPLHASPLLSYDIVFSLHIHLSSTSALTCLPPMTGSQCTTSCDNGWSCSLLQLWSQFTFAHMKNWRHLFDAITYSYVGVLLSLQDMHDRNIENRTRMRLQHEVQAMEQRLKEFKITREHNRIAQSGEFTNSLCCCNVPHLHTCTKSIMQRMSSPIWSRNTTRKWTSKEPSIRLSWRRRGTPRSWS